MVSRPATALERELAAYWSWWREAGVDNAFADEPRALLRLVGVDRAAPGGTSEQARETAPAPLRPAQPSPARPAIGGAPEAWPRDPAAWRAWWLAEPSLELPGSGPRLAPRGDAGAALMILVPMPEAHDRDRLLEGREGALVEAMLASMAIAPADAYIAAALPRHMAAPDWDGLDAAGFVALTRHHLALARPQRLLVLGHAILPLLGHGSSQPPAAVRETAISDAPDAARIPTLAGFAPGRLLENARQRALLWRRWLEWTHED